MAAVQRRRRELHGALEALERALAGAAGRPTTWRDAVAAALARLQATLAEHVEETEGPDGLFAQVREHAPRLEARIERLRREHGELEERTAALLSDLRGEIPDQDDVRRRRDEAMDLLATVVRHRQLGADLLWEAYEVDVSAGD